MIEGCPYELGRMLGEGGMAQVFEGVHRDRGHIAAVKVGKNGPLSVPRLRVESETLEQLDHMHVMPILEIGADRSWYAMAMADYSLEDLYGRGGSEEALRSALSALSGGLIHVHANGYVHRDVSPANLLMGRNNHWLLSDFGLVLPLGGKKRIRTGPTARIGTPFFSAPEVHDAPSSATSAADAWSIGALASWFLGGPRVDDLFWEPLIRNTLVQNPHERWDLPKIASHLTKVPITVGVRMADRYDDCFRCGVRSGLDGAGRCRKCGFQAED